MLKDADVVARDPVCGVQVERATAAHVIISGKKFFFCGERCRTAFLAQSEDTPHHADYVE